MSRNDKVAEQLLETSSERPQGHVLNTPEEPTAKEKNKAKTQSAAIQHDLGAKYTLRDLYVAYEVKGRMLGTQSGTKAESWKAAVREVLKSLDRQTTTGRAIQEEFEQQFPAALRAVKAERNEG